LEETDMRRVSDEHPTWRKKQCYYRGKCWFHHEY